MKVKKQTVSTILTVIGGVGVVVTAVMAVKATPKALKKIEEAEEIKGEELTNFEKIKVAGTTYIPTLVVGASTVACMVGANILNTRQQAALMSAYAFLDSSYKDYRRKLIELHGEEAHEEIVNALAIEKAQDTWITANSFVSNTCLSTDKACGEPVLFYDSWSGRYFENTIEQVMAAEYHINRNFTLRGYVTLNEFYTFLGLEETDHGDGLGWTVEDELYWVDFNHRKVELEDGLEVIILESDWDPSSDFLEYYYY